MHKGRKVDTAVVYTYDDHRSIITYEGSCKHKCKKKDLDYDFQKPCEYTPRPGNEIIVSFQEAKTARELSVENEADPKRSVFRQGFASRGSKDNLSSRKKAFYERPTSPSH